MFTNLLYYLLKFNSFEYLITKIASIRLIVLKCPESVKYVILINFDISRLKLNLYMYIYD